MTLAFSKASVKLENWQSVKLFLRYTACFGCFNWMLVRWFISAAFLPLRYVCVQSCMRAQCPYLASPAKRPEYHNCCNIIFVNVKLKGYPSHKGSKIYWRACDLIPRSSMCRHGRTWHKNPSGEVMSCYLDIYAVRKVLSLNTFWVKATQTLQRWLIICRNVPRKI